MAKRKPNLNAVFDSLEAIPAPAQPAPPTASAKPRTGRPRRTEETSLVGGQLAKHYSKSLNMLSAETGKTNRQLLEEALDKLFVAYGARRFN